MSFDLLITLALSVLGLVAHAARHQTWLQWILRSLIILTIAGELVLVGSMGAGDSGSSGSVPPGQWAMPITASVAALTVLVLFQWGRKVYAFIFSCLDYLVSGQMLVALCHLLPKKASLDVTAALKQSFADNRILVVSSFPHLVALWIFVSAVGHLLVSTDPEGMALPSLPIPLPVQIDSLLQYNGFGLIALAVCGVGIFITRKPKETLGRLGLLKPTLAQVGVGLLLVLMTCGYDALWALYTHSQGTNLASKLSSYNAGTFTAGGGAVSSAFLAVATGVCAGVGEETLMRGALQPVFGIFPAAVLHALLHGQFSHSPIFIIQIAIWSTMMGIARRYTNTTTTIIGHLGFNLIMTFLFAFNPGD